MNPEPTTHEAAPAPPEPAPAPEPVVAAPVAPEPDPEPAELAPVGPLSGLAPREKAVVVFGRTWPKADLSERLFWAFAFLACTAVLLIALRLQPDGRGVGTHEQLGLPPCGFVAAWGIPCPSCGFTTTYTLAAHGRPWAAIKNQPFGFFLFCLTVLGSPGSLLAAWRGVSLLDATVRWPWGKILLGLLAGWLLSWAYKWAWAMW